MAIPASVWQAEPRHKGIWQAQGPCVKCHMAARDALCPKCLEPMCAKCLRAHLNGMDHAREAYLERLARKQISSASSTPEEIQEALTLQRKWEQKDSAPAVGVKRAGA